MLPEYRPWRSFGRFDKEIGKYVGPAETARLAQYCFIPIPGLGQRMLREFKEYRPYKTIEQFQKEIGKYAGPKEVARLERYVTIQEGRGNQIEGEKGRIRMRGLITIGALSCLLFSAQVLASPQEKKPVELSPAAPKDKPVSVESKEELAAVERAIKPYIEKARRTYPQARARFLAGLPPKHAFFVTARLRDKAGHVELAFIAVRRIEKGVVEGRIANDVTTVSGYKEGDPYSLKEDDLVDWTISKPDGTEEGNFVGKFLETYRPVNHDDDAAQRRPQRSRATEF